MLRRALLVLAAVCGSGLLAQAAAADVQSSNWAGYAIADAATAGGTEAAASLTFSSVTGSWVEPRARCTAGSPSYSAFWVGLGGLAADAQALEQIGTSADCSASGSSVYGAWYELVPAAPVRIPLKIAPGDLITTSVNVRSAGVLLQIKDRTRRRSFTRLLPVMALDATSAEWIAEAPSDCDADLTHCRALPLANFGTVSFSRIAAIANDHPGTIVDPTWSATAIHLVPDGDPLAISSPTATPAALSADGRAFQVVYGS